MIIGIRCARCDKMCIPDDMVGVVNTSEVNRRIDEQILIWLCAECAEKKDK
jgi:hypothetical protein